MPRQLGIYLANCHLSKSVLGDIGSPVQDGLGGQHFRVRF